MTFLGVTESVGWASPWPRPCLVAAAARQGPHSSSPWQLLWLGAGSCWVNLVNPSGFQQDNWKPISWVSPGVSWSAGWLMAYVGHPALCVLSDFHQDGLLGTRARLSIPLAQGAETDEGGVAFSFLVTWDQWGLPPPSQCEHLCAGSPSCPFLHKHHTPICWFSL